VVRAGASYGSISESLTTRRYSKSSYYAVTQLRSYIKKLRSYVKNFYFHQRQADVMFSAKCGIADRSKIPTMISLIRINSPQHTITVIRIQNSLLGASERSMDLIHIMPVSYWSCLFFDSVSAACFRTMLDLVRGVVGLTLECIRDRSKIPGTIKTDMRLFLLNECRKHTLHTIVPSTDCFSWTKNK
jgi:hypothetical protein